MDILLYNPLSRNGKNDKLVLKMQKRLSKDGTNVKIKSLLEIVDIEAYINSTPKNDRFIIVGGDGTLNYIANQIKDIEIKQEVYLLKAGTGNDFARSIKAKKELVPIKAYLKDLPSVNFKGSESLFLNGVGIGLDGLVVDKVNQSSRTKTKRNYLLNTYKAFKEFKPFKSEVIVNGETINNDKTWMVVVMNSKYLGGGMKMAPKAKRTDKDLYVLIIKSVPKPLLFVLFPLIYVGLHVFMKRYITVIKTQEVIIKSNRKTYIQIDGEDHMNVDEIHIKR